MERNISSKSHSFSNRDENSNSDTTESVDHDPVQANEEIENDNAGETKVEVDFETSFRKIVEEVDRFLQSVSASKDCQIPPDVPECFDRLVTLIDGEIAKYDPEKDPGEDSPFLDAIERVSRLVDSLAGFKSESKYRAPVDRASCVLQRAMVVLEEEFCSVLETSKIFDDSQPEESVAVTTAKPKKQMSFTLNIDLDRSPKKDSPGKKEANLPAISPVNVTHLKQIASAMFTAGYGSECSHVYAAARRNAFDDSLTKISFEKLSIEDIQKMSWETLEGEIATWITAVKRCISSYFPAERSLCESIFPTSVSSTLLWNMARGVVIRFLTFAEAVAMTKRSAEKLFKFLDMYEALRDLIPALEELFQGESSPELKCELKSETASARSRLGEAAVSIFSELENSIRADNGKTPVPGGAVHPLTRYIMNYLKYACEYKDTLEQVFNEHQKIESSSESGEGANHGDETPAMSPFSVQLTAVMDLLDTNLDSKSKLYKDLSLNYIFLMNNGRYIMQKIKGSPEIHSLLRDTRKRSSELRQYHKNYTRETWSKVLACLKDDGLMQGKGSINKPVLKERFKSFNALFEEIHKTQSAWVVSDEQLQSELRVSISAVVVPAYRSFLGRFSQYLDAGRQTEKYIKIGAEEFETYIDELFDGTPASLVRRRT